MPEESKFVAGTIEDVLVALATGIGDAQDKLNNLDPFDNFGRPLPQYHLPYLDFDLKITVQSVESSNSQSALPLARAAATENAQPRLARNGGLAVSRPMMSLAMPRPNVSTRSDREIVSSLSGRFVSVPPNDGMPQLSIFAAAETTDVTNKFILKIQARFGDGQLAPNRTVECNIDEAVTIMANSVTQLSVSGADIFSSGEALTNRNGVAEFSADLSAISDPDITEVHLIFNIGPVQTRMILERA